MRITLHYGRESLDVDVGDNRVVGLFAGPTAPALASVADAVPAALAAPFHFPPLHRSVVPGDHVVVVTEPHSSDPNGWLSPVLAELVRGGVEPAAVTLLEAAPLGGDRATEPLSPLADPWSAVHRQRHDPHDRSRLAYLATTAAGQRVYLNRAMVDADLVVLVGRIGYDPLLGYRGTASILYPGLSDEETARRLRRAVCNPSGRPPSATRGPAGKAAAKQTRQAPPVPAGSARDEVDEIAWLLGLQFAVGAVEGLGDNFVHVLAGASDSVFRRGRELLHREWKFTTDQRADVVVATIQGDPRRHTMADIGSALAAACRLVKSGGKIVLLCQVAAKLGVGAEWMAAADEPADVVRQLQRHCPADAVSTLQLATAFETARVYLLSGLSAELVEDLFVTPLETPGEVRRLLETGDETCVFVADAHRVSASVQQES